MALFIHVWLFYHNHESEESNPRQDKVVGAIFSDVLNQCSLSTSWLKK